ncbi:MAG: Rab family GTPase [Bacteroidia bacterium]
MDSTKWISKKIALLGNHAVGKTSLISRFVENKFPEAYLTTIGLKVDKKTIEIDGYKIDLVIWDIAGQENLANIPHYYLNGCSGYIYVVDLTRPSTYENLQSQTLLLKGILPEAETVLTGNKCDLLKEDELKVILEDFNIQPDKLTSAKTGENVEELFMQLARKLIHQHETQGS